jgi:hypothetical protein
MDDEGLCVRYLTDGSYRIVNGGSTYVNWVEISLANYYLSGGDTRYLNNIPNTSPALLQRSLKAVKGQLGIGSYDPIFDLAFMDPGHVASFAGAVGSFLWDGTELAYNYLARLQGSNPNAHALSKHAPGASDADLMAKSVRSPVAQTKFTSEDEMANAVSTVLSTSTNMAEIQQMAGNSQAGSTIEYDGPSVNYSGFRGGHSINGQALARVVIVFDGKGGWSLYTAFPYVP